jgi:error-prone DNA polymerase
MVEGQLQIEGEVIHVVVRKCYNLSRLLGKLTASDELLTKPMSRSDETSSPFLEQRQNDEVMQGRIFPEGRNFR